jgi:hypothetical protein
LLTATDSRTQRNRAATVLCLACALAGLVAVARPNPADSAPARVIVLGLTDTAPKPSCPGRIINNVEVVPCRVEGHVTGFQVMAGGVPNPYEVPFDGKVIAWSIALARPSREDTAKTTDEVGFFNDFLGTTSAPPRSSPSSTPSRCSGARSSP